MKALLFFLAILSFTFLKAQTITPEQAKDSIGKQTTVCGSVTGTHTSEKVTFINMGGTFPNNAFTAVVFKDSAAKFTYPVSSLDGKFICITGIVKDFKGKAEMIVNNEAQITVKMAVTPQSQRE